MAQSKVQRNSRVSQGTHPAASEEELADRFMEEVRGDDVLHGLSGTSALVRS